MSTVGLSFGSPTSGAGFDVSSTVAEIISNLQNVETPWKTQLSTLESQNTAISNLGSLLSSVSTDISQLTDFEGIMAQKEGSSSDTSVLELTAATTSAAAGTHTVVVNSLAQTSSGYLAEVASTSDTLSGSVTLKVGSGTAQTITLSSSDDTLSGLASAINDSGLGITANVLTDATGSRLSLVSGTSGANGNISVTANTLTAAVSNTLGATVTAGTSSTASKALLAAVASSSEQLTGSLAVTVGSGSQQSIAMSTVSSTEGGTTLSDLQQYIHSNSSTLGFDASLVNNTDGTVSLQLTANTASSSDSLAVSSSLVDSSTALAYTNTVTGANASLTVDGVSLTSASNTVSNLIPGITFQLLGTSSSGSEVQVVISNDNTAVESTVNQLVSDYNSLISAVNTQEGVDSSGNAEPLFGSPTLSLLQQELLNSLSVVNPNGTLDSVASDAGVTLSGSMTIATGSGTKETIEIGSGTSSDGTFYTGTGSGYNTLAGLAAAINTAAADTQISYTAGSSTGTGSLTVTNTSLLTGSAPELTGDLTIQVGSGSTQTIDMSDVDSAEGGTTLSDLATYITANKSTLGVSAAVTDNGDGTSTLALTSTTSGDALTVDSSLAVPGSGVTASVVTSDGDSTLALYSQTAGSSGALTVTSAIEASTPKALSYTDSGYTSATADSGALGSSVGSTDALAGSLTVQVGSGSAQTIAMSAVDTAEGGTTLSDLQQYIASNSSTLGFTASLASNGESLTLTSSTDGSTGALTVTSSLYDTANSTSKTLAYTNSSDINSLTTLGISMNDDGSLTFDATSLDSVLNTDYASVVGFFQNTNSWGQSFSTVLTDAGTSSTTGLLSVAASANSTIESTLNADISREQSYISAQQSSLTKELDQANEILEELPSQLQGINELYSAITGYDQNTSG